MHERETILNSGEKHVIVVGKGMLLTTNFNWRVIKQVLEIPNLSRGMNDIAFVVVGTLVGYNYNFSYGSILLPQYEWS